MLGSDLRTTLAAERGEIAKQFRGWVGARRRNSGSVVLNQPSVNKNFLMCHCAILRIKDHRGEYSGHNNVVLRFRIDFLVCAYICLAIPVVCAAQEQQWQNLFDQGKPKLREIRWSEESENEYSREFSAVFPSSVLTKVPQNNTVKLRLFIPTEKPAKVPCVLILHYWGATSLRFERALALELASRGIAAAIMPLPYHLGRNSPGASSGSEAIVPDPAAMRQMVTQAVGDVSLSLQAVRLHPEIEGVIGLVGTSLGAIIAGSSYALESDLPSAAFILGGANLASLVFDSSLTASVRRQLIAKGIPETALAAELAPIEPTNLLRGRKHGQTLLFKAQYDTVIPPKSTMALQQSLESPTVLELSTGHYGGVIIQGRIIKETARFFEAVAAKTRYVAPTSLSGPTVTVGFLSLASGRQSVVAGVNLLSLDSNQKRFLQLLVTPQSPVLFIGQEFLEHVSFGIAITPKRATFGLKWSVVL
jgi:hypothetical protein